MDKGRQKAFWVVTGVAAGIAVALFGVLVVPQWTMAATKKAAINKEIGFLRTAVREIPGKDNRTEWTVHETNLKQYYQEMLQTYLRADESLERWFEGLESDSTFDTFWTRLEDEKGKLENEVLARGIKLGSPKDDGSGQLTETRVPGFSWISRDDATKAAQTIEEQNEAKATLQKRFNISKAIANAITQERGKPNRLIDVTFLQRSLLRKPGRSPIPFPAPGTIPVSYNLYLGYTGPTYTEFTLPTSGEAPAPAGEAAPGTTEPAAPEPPLGRTITFGFCVDMAYEELPDLVRNLVYPTQQPILSLTVVGLRAFIAEPNEILRTEKRRVTSDQDRMAFEKELEVKSAEGKPAPVRVYFTCQVFDFDPASVPAHLRK